MQHCVGQYRQRQEKNGIANCSEYKPLDIEILADKSRLLVLSLSMNGVRFAQRDFQKSVRSDTQVIWLIFTHFYFKATLRVLFSFLS